jgi:hypothetical protein
MLNAIRPNWSALAALFRTLIILGASTFAGAFVLPLSMGGGIPDTWAAWRPVLAVAGAAALTAEVIWIRAHLQALAASMGLGGTTVQTTTSMTAHTDPPAATAAKVAPLTTLLMALGLVLAVSQTGCVGGVPTAQTQLVIDDSAQLALCTETVIQKDESATPPAAIPQMLLDEGVTCGPEAAALVTAIGQEVNSTNTAAVIQKAHNSVMARRAAAKAGH